MIQIESGTILYSTWGYEQTNVDFYVVVKGGAVGKMIQLQPIRKSYQATGDMTGKVMPLVIDGLPFKVGEVLTRKLGPGWNGKGYVKLTSYSGAQVWDGVAKGVSSYA
jgi:hypothetical protein